MRISDWNSDVCSSDLLDAVIVAPQHPVWAEIEGLLRRMARDIGRKFDAQAAPDLALAVPRIDLLDLKPRAREEEGRGEIGPDRITAEIDDVMAVPRRRPLVIGEGGPGRRPFADRQLGIAPCGERVWT